MLRCRHRAALCEFTEEAKKKSKVKRSPPPEWHPSRCGPPPGAPGGNPGAKFTLKFNGALEKTKKGGRGIGVVGEKFGIKGRVPKQKLHRETVELVAILVTMAKNTRRYGKS